MKLAAFLDEAHEAIADAVLRAYPPLYNAETRRSCGFDVRRLGRRPLGAQADAIRAVALSLQRQPGTILVGEMGVGKSTIAAAAAYLGGCRQVFLLCPPHLVRKWQREIHQTVPGARSVIVRTIQDLERTRNLESRLQFTICSREQAKLGYRWRPATVLRLARDSSGEMLRDEAGRPYRVLSCPTCFGTICDDEGIPLGLTDLSIRKRRCSACNGPLWQADRTGPRRFPLAEYVRRRMQRHFDLLIVDEVHEEKGQATAQGLAAGTLAAACGRSLILTGTLLGGYASTLFFLLWRFSPAVRAEFSYADVSAWVSRYGYIERITKKDSDDYLEDGRRSRRRTYPTRIVEKPGVTPPIILQLIGNTVFVRLADVAADLPPYTERVQLVPLERGGHDDAFTQSSCYDQLARQLHQAVRRALQLGSKRLLGAYLQALLSYPDACTREERVIDPLSGDELGYAPALPADRLYPKERALIELVARERARGRRLLCYLTHTGVRDLSPRLEHVLREAGFRVAVLKAATVTPERREEWVAARVREGVDVLLTNPRLVQTGLDLIDFPSLVWVEIDYSVYVLRQASRRSWRIGQRQPVTVTYLAYADTLQAQALGLVAAKTRASLMVEGDLPEEGLAALDADGGNLVVALARRLAEPASADTRSLEALFAEAHQQARAADDWLVNEDSNVVSSVDCADAAQPPPPDSPRASANLFIFGDLPLFAAGTPATPSAEHQQSQDGLSLTRLSQLLVTQRGG